MQHTKERATTLTRALIRPDQNILRWSALFATSKFKGQSREHSFETPKGHVGIVIGKHTKQTGEVVELGVLRVPDLIYLAALITVWEDQGKPTEAVAYRMADFLRIAGKSSDGVKNYKGATQSLKNLKSIPITWNASFKINTQEGVQDINVVEEMNLLGRLVWVSKRSNKTRGKREVIGFKFKFHDMILENMLSGYTRPFNYRVITELKSELSILTYMHLDTVMADKKAYVRRSESLFKQLGLSDYKYPSKRLEKFKGVLEELQGKPLSTGLITSIDINKTKDGKDWKLVVRKMKFTEMEARRDQTAELEYYVKEALEIIGETANDVTRKFLFKAGYRLGADAINMAARRVKTDFQDNKSIMNKPNYGQALWKELSDLADARGVDLS